MNKTILALFTGAINASSWWAFATFSVLRDDKCAFFFLPIVSSIAVLWFLISELANNYDN